MTRDETVEIRVPREDAEHFLSVLNSALHHGTPAEQYERLTAAVRAGIYRYEHGSPSLPAGDEGREALRAWLTAKPMRRGAEAAIIASRDRWHREEEFKAPAWALAAAVLEFVAAELPASLSSPAGDRECELGRLAFELQAIAEDHQKPRPILDADDPGISAMQWAEGWLLTLAEIGIAPLPGDAQEETADAP